MEQDLLELQARHEALNLACTGLVSLPTENVRHDVGPTLGALLSGLSERANPHLANALMDIANSID